VAAFVVGCDLPTAPPRFETTFVVPVESVTVFVTSHAVSASTIYDLSDTNDLAGRVRGGALVIDVANPSGATGLVHIRVSGGGGVVEGTVDLAGNGQRIPASQAAMQALLGQSLTIAVSGTMCPQSGCNPTTLPPFPSVTFTTSLELMLELGGEG
jgi:hypothetical protein